MHVPEVALPHQGEEIVADYRATGLTLGRHSLALLRPVLDRLGYADTRELSSLRSGASIRLPGLVLMRQRPSSARGVVFMTVKDEHGVGNLVVHTDVAASDRAALVAGRLLIPESWVERQKKNAEVPITHLIIRRPINHSGLLGCLIDPGLKAEDSGWMDRVLGRADEMRRPEPRSHRAGQSTPVAGISVKPPIIEPSPGRTCDVQPPQHRQGSADDPRIRPRHNRPGRQPAAAPRRVPGLCRADHPKPASSPGAPDSLRVPANDQWISR
jgi:hypothetical protein